MKLVAESLNEIKNREKLIKRREKLLSDLEKARSNHKKAVDRKSEFIEKYGEDAWWNNLSYYKDGYNAGSSVEYGHGGNGGIFSLHGVRGSDGPDGLVIIAYKYK